MEPVGGVRGRAMSRDCGGHEVAFRRFHMKRRACGGSEQRPLPLSVPCSAEG